MHRGILAGALALLLAQPATADDNDFVMSRLGVPVTDGSGQVIDVVGDNRRYRSLMSEFGVAMAPRLIEPADTLGFGGFQFAADIAFTSISSGEDYWDVLERPSDGFLNTVGFFARKGIWLPLPSFEIGAGAVHLLDSELWAAQAYAKFAVHEGYHDLPLPSLAVRGGVSRVMGSEQIDLTVASIDIVASKSFGLGGVVNLTPYGGWNLLIIVPRSEVIDKTPNIDVLEQPEDSTMNFVFSDQDNIYRNRFFGGVKLKYYVFTVAFEANLAMSGGSKDDRSGTDMQCTDGITTDNCDSTDEAAAQQTYTISIGLDF